MTISEFHYQFVSHNLHKIYHRFTRWYRKFTIAFILKSNINFYIKTGGHYNISVFQYIVFATKNDREKGKWYMFYLWIYVWWVYVLEYFSWEPILVLCCIFCKLKSMTFTMLRRLYIKLVRIMNGSMDISRCRPCSIWKTLFNFQ